MKIEHVALYVNDLEKARNFFMRYLGASSYDGYHNPKSDFRSYFLSFDDGARLELMQKPGMSDLPKDLARTGCAHIAFSVGSKEKVDALDRSAESRRLRGHQRPPHNGRRLLRKLYCCHRG